MNCRECHDKLSLYLDGQLTDEERLRVEEALERCPECAEELAALSSLTKEMGEFGDVPIPTDLLQDLKSAFRQELTATAKKRSGPSFLHRMGGWRIAASVAALLFATWAIVEDRAQRVTPQDSFSQEFVTLSDGESGSGRRSASTMDGIGAPEEEVDEDDEFIGSSNSSRVPAGSVAEASSPSAGKKGQAPKRGRVESKALKAEMASDDRDRTVLAVSPTKKQYLNLVPEMKSHLGLDFQAEPWPAFEGGFASSVKGIPLAKKSIGDGVDKGGRVGRFPKTPKGKAKGKGGSKGARRNEVSPLPPVSSAFFALGPNASETIRAVVQKAGLRAVPSKLGSLSQDKAESVEGEILTVELSKSQRDALLKDLGTKKNLRIQLFGRGGERLLRPGLAEETEQHETDVPHRKELSKSAPASKGGQLAKGRNRQADAKAPARNPKTTQGKKAEPRYRLSFILLRP